MDTFESDPGLRTEQAHHEPDQARQPELRPLDDAALGRGIAALIPELTQVLPAPVPAAAVRLFKDLVCEYTDTLKRDGHLPEQVIIAVRRAVLSASTSSDVSSDRIDELARLAVQHCISRYFAGEPPMW